MEDLHEVLGALHVKDPIVLVGHSLGGFYARYYQLRHPYRVAAMVLVD